MPIESSGSGLLVKGVGFDSKPSTSRNMLSEIGAEIEAEDK